MNQEKCKICSSQAINDGQHDRAPGVDLDLCDVCYWRTRAIQSATKLVESEIQHGAAQTTLAKVLSGVNVNLPGAFTTEDAKGSRTRSEIPLLLAEYIETIVAPIRTERDNLSNELLEVVDLRDEVARLRTEGKAQIESMIRDNNDLLLEVKRAVASRNEEKARADAAEAKAAGLAVAVDDFLFWFNADGSPCDGPRFREDAGRLREALRDAAPILAAHVGAAVGPVRAERDEWCRRHDALQAAQTDREAAYAAQEVERATVRLRAERDAVRRDAGAYGAEPPGGLRREPERVPDGREGEADEN